MSTISLPIGLQVGTLAVLAFAPTATTNVREHVPVEWAQHGQAPARASDGVFLGASAATIVVSTTGTIVSQGVQLHAYPLADRIEAIMSRIAHLSTLEPGWVGPGSLPPSEDVLAWLRGHAATIAGGSHAVSLIPMEDGSVAIRWSQGDREYTAEVRPGLVLYTFIDDLASDEFFENEGPLTEERLQAFLRSSGA